MDLHPSESSKLEPGTGRSWIVAVGSFCFVLLQSACTAVTAISGLRLLIGLTSLTAASLIPGFIFTIHTDRIRIPMLIVAVVGSLVNLYVLWRIRSLAVPAIIAVENSTSDCQTAPVREVSVRSLRPHTCAGCH